MSEQSTEPKRVYIYMNAEQHMKLKIRLDYHRMSMSEFVRSCSQALLDGNETMEEFIAEYKEGSDKHSKRNSKIVADDLKRAAELSEDLNLDGDEIEDIFDLIEEDHPEI